MKLKIIISFLIGVTFGSQAMQEVGKQLVAQKQAYTMLRKSPIDIFVELPSDIRTHLLKILFHIPTDETDFLYSKINIQSPALVFSDCLLEHVIDVKRMAPFRIGNKTLEFESLMITTQKNRNDLIALVPDNAYRAFIEGRTDGELQQDLSDLLRTENPANPKHMLERQPSHIIKGLQVDIRSRIPLKELVCISIVSSVANIGLLWIPGVPLSMSHILITVGIWSAFSISGYLTFRCIDKAQPYSVDTKRYL